MSKVTCTEAMFGTKMKGAYNADADADSKPTVARIEEVNKFINWSFWPVLTPWGESSIFTRFGYHAKCLMYINIGFGVFAFTCAVNDTDLGGTTGAAFLFGPNELSIANRMMTFVLSSYVVLMVKTYHVGVRSKSRSMMYGASRAVDTLCMTVDYDHQRADQFLKTAHGAMTAIGQYALIIASKSCRFKKSKDEIIQFFEDRGLDGKTLSQLPPKQSFHVLRLAIIQAVRDERDRKSSCFNDMSDNDWVALREQLNEYCAGASTTSSSISSSKLPYSYVQLVNWGTNFFIFFQVIAFYQTKAYYFSASDVYLDFISNQPLNRAEAALHLFHFIIFNLFEIFIVYFVLGCLEVYHSLSDIWAEGLVLQNYIGIIDMICLPLLPNAEGQSLRLRFADISSKASRPSPE